MKRTNGKALSVNNAKRRIGINARRVITLTLSNIALQALGFVYRMMLTDCAGTTALGLQSLVMQIYSIAVSVCISGLNVAVITVAARLNAAGGRGIRTLTRCALLAFCVLFLLSAVPSFILRRSIALRLIGDCKTEGAIPLVLICIFLTGTENILKSVHIAAGHVRTTAFSEITEQTARFFLVWLLLKSFAANSAFAMQGEPSFSVKLIITGMVLSEFFSVGFLSVSYFRTFVKKNRTFADTRPAAGRFSGLFSELCEILLPAALTSVLGTVFSSAAALLLPGRLYAAGYSREAALQTIGVLNSVAVPLVVLPMAFAGAVAAVCMPAVSAAVQNNNENLHRIVKKSVGVLTFAVAANLLLLPFLKKLSALLFGIVPDWGVFILLTLKSCIIHFQIVTTAILNGLKEQKIVLAYTVLSEGLQLILIYLFAALPQLHIYGCLAAMAAGEGLRLALSVKRIRLILNGNVKGAERRMLPQ